MTPEKNEEIQTMLEKITDFLERLAIEHEEFDIRFVNFDIEGHFEDEGEKETVLQVTINDCGIVDENDANKDRVEVKTELETEKNVSEEETQLEKQDEITKDNKQVDNMESEKESEKISDLNTPKKVADPDKSKSITVASYEVTSKSKPYDAHDVRGLQKEILAWKSNKPENKPRVKPTVVYIKLSEKEQEIVKVLEKKRGKGPIIMVMDKGNGTRRIILPRKK